MIVTAVTGLVAFAARRLFWLTEKHFSVPVLVFVSTGGTCRDPMAKVIMEQLAEKRGAKIRVYAAGVAQGHSKTAAKAAKIVVREQLGADLLGRHRTRQLSGRLATKADLILAMEDYHASEVKKLFPYTTGKTHTLAAFLGTKDITNPYLQHDEVDCEALDRYRSTYHQIEKALTAHADRIFVSRGIGGVAPEPTVLTL